MAKLSHELLWNKASIKLSIWAVSPKLRGLLKSFAKSCIIAGSLSLVFATPPVQASNTTTNVLIIGNDYGGVLVQRLANLQALRLRGTTVEIRGDICASACTLYLGLENTCILPQTRFGFHGPSSHGKPLPRADYERLSQVVAAQYPSVLRDWYITSGRLTLVRMQYISGRTLIDLGLRQCAGGPVPQAQS